MTLYTLTEDEFSALFLAPDAPLRLTRLPDEADRKLGRMILRLVIDERQELHTLREALAKSRRSTDELHAIIARLQAQIDHPEAKA